MPSYNFKCPACGWKTSRWFKINARNKEGGACLDCGEPMVRVYGVGLINGHLPGFSSNMLDGSIRGLNEQAEASERKRKGDDKRKEMGLEHFNVKKNIH